MGEDKDNLEKKIGADGNGKGGASSSGSSGSGSNKSPTQDSNQNSSKKDAVKQKQGAFQMKTRSNIQQLTTKLGDTDQIVTKVMSGKGSGKGGSGSFEEKKAERPTGNKGKG